MSQTGIVAGDGRQCIGVLLQGARRRATWASSSQGTCLAQAGRQCRPRPGPCRAQHGLFGVDGHFAPAIVTMSSNGGTTCRSRVGRRVPTGEAYTAGRLVNKRKGHDRVQSLLCCGLQRSEYVRVSSAAEEMAGHPGRAGRIGTGPQRHLGRNERDDMTGWRRSLSRLVRWCRTAATLEGGVCSPRRSRAGVRPRPQRDPATEYIVPTQQVHAGTVCIFKCTVKKGPEFAKGLEPTPREAAAACTARPGGTVPMCSLSRACAV